MNDFREYSDYLNHHGVKGMHWGIRRYQNLDGTLTALGKSIQKVKTGIDKGVKTTLGVENETFNRLAKSSGKLRKTYYEMQKFGIKYKDGKYRYTKRSNEEYYKKQRALQVKAKRYTDDYIKKYGNEPISYMQSINAQKGAAVGVAVAAVLPIVGVWGTVPLGYYVGSKIGKR